MMLDNSEMGQAMADVTLSEGFAQGKHVARAEGRPGVAPPVQNGVQPI